jgi:hypothetical protein
MGWDNKFFTREFLCMRERGEQGTNIEDDAAMGGKL